MTYNGKWMNIRAEAYNKYAASTQLCDKIDLHIFPPEYGWIDMTFTVSGKEYMVTLSSCPEPFVYIKTWLEELVLCPEYIENTLTLNCDYSYDTVFHYERLAVKNGHVTGIFCLFDSTEDDFLSGYVDLHELVELIYTKILNYAEQGEANEEFVENWLEYVSDDDYPDRRLSSTFRSEIIEAYIGGNK